MFQIGTKVFYPMHGAGIIKDIQDKEIFGVRKKYYIVQFPLNSMTVMLPVEHVEKVGLREIVDKNTISQLEFLLRSGEDPTEKSWNQRFRENANMLKSGDIFGLAQVVKSLTQRDREKGLSTGEKKMLEDARLYLTSEIALAKNIKQEQAIQFLEDAIP
ncbi:CarD family transcriptional regulator [Ammoniphilus resinae]|uniref:CarD family transcriptional regulator n=1 Tax=Ammoniphilus resinae TaxID=861532 RepID=A0ABS4GK19_9BACL|nr:CarD family transcriptional regulator [Ammoniphilus resinae]MBP1930603.1 CarD family transcriptional regulator [Ammoniphilus resinae]